MRVQLSGEITSDDWGPILEWFDIPCFYPAKVRQAVEDNPEGEDLVLEINSVGGSVFAGFEIYSVLRAARCRTVAEVQSLAASAASTIMLGCDEVTASPVAQVMIHLPSTCTEGDRYDHMDSVRTLDSITESILNAYVIRSGGKATRQELKSLMRTTAWLTAPEAKGLGLVDRILGEEELDPDTVLNCVRSGRGFARMGLRQPEDRAQLLARYREAVDRGEAPEVPALGIFRDDDWELGPEALRKGSEKPENAAEAQRKLIMLTASFENPEKARKAWVQVRDGEPVVNGPEGFTIRKLGPTDVFAEALAVLELEKIRFGGM